ncbi:MAG: anthranilate synthase component I [Acidiferrobacterales bacterium]
MNTANKNQNKSDSPEFKKHFEALVKKGYNRIPVARQVLADLDTPLSAYLKLANGPYTYLFESVQGGEKWGRFSIIGLPCHEVITVTGNEIEITKAGKVIKKLSAEDPLQWIDDFRNQYKIAELDGLPRFTGGLVGYFGYDTVRLIEKKLGPCNKPDSIGAPDILLMVSEEVVVFDNLSGKLHLVVHANPENKHALELANKRLDELANLLHQPVPNMSSNKTGANKKVHESDFVSGFTQAGYEAAVSRAREYIKEGDVMQVVVSQLMSIPYTAPPLDLYRALRMLNPSPYMYYLDMDGFQVVGSSPEILVRLEDGEVTVRPIAGTRPRGKTTEEDLQLEQDLLADPKELAEHLMLIDLGRNDAGRVSETGTIELTDKMIVERYSHVMHIVSNVIGKLKKGMGAIDVLKATFPAGTVSGAPKVRAMEIIDELEPSKRGIYSGAVGYISWTGDMDTAIAIRTAVIKNDTLYIQAGAGIVYDSVPRNEWDETMNKGRAIFRAVAMASSGLNNKD